MPSQVGVVRTVSLRRAAAPDLSMNISGSRPTGRSTRSFRALPSTGCVADLSLVPSLAFSGPDGTPDPGPHVATLESGTPPLRNVYF